MNGKIAEVCEILRNGGIISYPTESVYGIGCDPFNQKAVQRIYELKQRPSNKSFILIGCSWQQLQPLTASITKAQLARVLATWPGPFTWIFPAAAHIPSWLLGPANTIALRWTSHPLAASLCKEFDAPIVSTSANRSGETALRSAQEVLQQFAARIDLIIDAPVGELAYPSEIRDVRTGTIVRAARSP